MKKIYLILLFLSSPLLYSQCPKILDQDIRLLDSTEYRNLCDYKEKTVLVVNVASRCGFTYQYEALQKLFLKFQSQDFVILGFPSRDFFFQEYKDESKVKEFCSTKYGVTFPMFSTSSVKGEKANKFFKDLAGATGEEPGWNFHKYLISREGRVESFSTKTEPDSASFIESIKKIL